MISSLARDLVITGAYGVAAAWIVRTAAALRFLPRLPNLLLPERDAQAQSSARVCVVVPARNEEKQISATLDSLLCQDYSDLEIVAVDDRSEDTTGTIINEYAASSNGRLRALHISGLPAGWLGKTHAMHTAVCVTKSEFLLFTDADILFAPSIIRRAVLYAQRTAADHVVVAPTPDIHGWGEGALLGFLQVLGLWASRPWRVADPKAKRDFLGIGAFNLVRRSAFERIGGWEKQKLAVVEDVVLGRRMKQAVAAQRFVTAREAVRVHWAEGLAGVIRVMTKNLFAVMFFQPLLVLTSCVFITLFFAAPLAGLFWRSTLIPSLLCIISISLCYRAMRPITSVSGKYFWLYPVGAFAFLFAMIRSMSVVLRHRGVEWRGTRYSLAELRANNRMRV